MRSFIILLLNLAIFCPLSGQNTAIAPSENWEKIKGTEDTLVILAYAMVNDSSPDNRFASCRQFIKTLVRALKVENSFHYPFERLRTVSIQYPPDSTFRIFSWQVYVDLNDYHYYGTIQLNTPDLKMIPLVDRSGLAEDPEMDVLTPENWYGALYYKIKSFPSATGTKYLLFGYDGFQFFNKRKLIDVLTLNDRQAVFGAPVFEKQDDLGQKTLVNRLILEYGSDASVRLNYDESLQMILFDHLVETVSPYPGQGVMFIPDGDTDGFYLENGIWKFKARVFDQTMDEAPRPQPVFENQKKDLFGKEKNTP